MRSAQMLVLVGALSLGACSAAQDGAASSSAPSPSVPSGVPIVIQTSMVIADAEHSEPIATGEIVDGSTLGAAPFCPGGTIRDTHASLDPAVEPLGLIDRTITCPDGTLRIVFTPGGAQLESETGSWTIVSGTGALEQLRGAGRMETSYDAGPDAPARETMTGTVTP